MPRTPELEPAPKTKPSAREFAAEKSPRKLGDANEFMATLAHNAASASAGDVHQKIRELEFVLQGQDRNVEIYADPNLQTFCCMEVPTKIRKSDGTMIEDKRKKTFLIGLPENYVKGKAPASAMRGWLWHELGHAQHTDFDLVKRLDAIAKKTDIPAPTVRSVFNCLEDGRMERNVGGPINDPQRLDLLEKHRMLVMPLIGEQLERNQSARELPDGTYAFDGGPIPPAGQFSLLLKLDRTWAMHRNDFGTELPKKFLKGVSPEVLKAYEKIRPTIIRITGDADTPALKKRDEVERLFTEEVLPVVKSLLQSDDTPKDENNDEKKEDRKEQKRENGGDHTSDEGSKGDNPHGDEGSSPESGPESKQVLDPKDPSSWPEELKQAAQKMLQQHEQRQDEEAARREAKQQLANARGGGGNNEIEKAEPGPRGERPKMSASKLKTGQETYEGLRDKARKTTSKLQSVFERFLPPEEAIEKIFGRRGLNFNAQRLVRNFGSGSERPLGRKEIVQKKKSMVLQITIDVSGSMYEQDQDRINNAVMGAVAVCEAARKAGSFGLDIEILASDSGNAETDQKYVIKAFNEPLNAETKARIGNILTDFGTEGNDDAASVEASFRRMDRKMTETHQQSEKTVGIMLFITDSTTNSEELKRTVEEKRKQIPIEGIAITPEKNVAKLLRHHFGKDSVVPASVDEFPDALATLIAKHAKRLA